MLFNSFSYLIFFPVVVLLYFAIPYKARYLWLLVASYYFYMAWNQKYALLIALSTVLTYASGLLIGNENRLSGAWSPGADSPGGFVQKEALGLFIHGIKSFHTLPF